MKLFITAIFDKKTNEYSSVTTCQNTVDAVRQFEIAKKSKDSILSFYPDFELRCLGSFDTQSGLMSQSDSFEVLSVSGGSENA